MGWILLAVATWGREFEVSTLSDTKGNARLPVISDTGLVAWYGYSTVEDETPLHTRTDVQKAPPGSHRSDIFVWYEGQVSNITLAASQIAGRSERPKVYRDQVVFTARFRDDAGGGLPFELSIPPKNETMLQMEADYPDLFETPSTVQEAMEPAPPPAGDTPPAEPPPPTTPEATPTPTPESTPAQPPPTRQSLWRGSGKAADIVLYQLNGELTRITPGIRHFSIPAISEAGIAFQCARGWPYGYEMLIWTPTATNLIQLTTNYFYVLNPDMHAQDLVFQAWDGNDYEIFHYRMDTGELRQITNNQFDDINPVVWNGQIAWVAHPVITPEIFLFAGGTIRKLSENTKDNDAPSIWEGRVVWQGYDDTDLEIYYFNGRRTIKLTSNTWDDMAPKIRDGLITWMSYVDNWDAEIMALDLSDNITVQLTDNEYEDSFPETASEKIVWQTLGFEGCYIQMATPKAPRERPAE